MHIIFSKNFIYYFSFIDFVKMTFLKEMKFQDSSNVVIACGYHVNLILKTG